MISVDRPSTEALPRVAFVLAQIAAAIVILVAGNQVDALPLWMLSIAWWTISTIAFGVPRSVASQTLVVVATAVLVRIDLAGLEPRGQVYGFAAVLVCAVPFVVRPIRRLDGFPVLHAFCLVQAIYLFVATTISDPSVLGETPYRAADREQGLLGYAIFMTIVVAVGCFVLRNQTATSPPAETTASASALAFRRGVVLFVGGVVARSVLDYLGLSGTIGELATIPTLVKAVGFLALTHLWLSNRLTPAQRVITMGIVVVDVVIGLGTGALYTGLALPLAALILAVAVRGRTPMLAIVLVLPVILVLNAAKSDFRALDQGGHVAGSQTSRGATFLGLSTELLREMTPDDFSASATRFAVSDTVGYIINRVPSRYPYWDKRSYTLLPYVVIPRAIAPWKPEIALANDFGRRYDLLFERDYETSVNTPLILESYANFGWVGLVVVGLFCGAVLGIAGRLIRRVRRADLLLGAVVAVTLAQGIESGMTAWVLALPTAVLLRPVTVWATEE